MPNLTPQLPGAVRIRPFPYRDLRPSPENEITQLCYARDLILRHAGTLGVTNRQGEDALHAAARVVKEKIAEANATLIRRKP